MKKSTFMIMLSILCLLFAGCEAYTDAINDIGSAYQEKLNEILDTDTKKSELDIIEETMDEANSTETGMKITMPRGSYDYIGNEKPVGRVVSELEKLGFTNIKTIEVEPGIYYFAVEGIKIYTDDSNSTSSFDKGDCFSSEDLIEIYYYGGPMEDGMIQDTDVFSIEKQLRSIEEYSWSDEHRVIKGRSGYFGGCFCKEKDIWVDLNANDLKEITSAKIGVYEEDYELLIAFASFFDTTLIDAEEVKQWISEYNKNGTISRIFGDAKYSLHYGLDDEEKITLYIIALE